MAANAKATARLLRGALAELAEHDPLVETCARIAGILDEAGLALPETEAA